jgi:hypothetical protein
VQARVLPRKREFENLMKPTNLIPDRVRKDAGLSVKIDSDDDGLNPLKRVR